MTLFFKNLKAAILSMKGEAMHQMWDDALDAAMNKMDEHMDARVREAEKRGTVLRDTKHLKVVYVNNDTSEDVHCLTATVELPNGRRIGLQTKFGPERFFWANNEIELLEIMYCHAKGIEYEL